VDRSLPEAKRNGREAFNKKYYRTVNGVIYLDPTLIPESRIPRLRWIQTLLETTQTRTPNFGCFGLHEWAMVYKTDNVRHRESAPLRLSQQQTNEVVESLHTNMDLYKWCYKAMPWISSDLLWRCFQLTKDIRELDMRASPYNLTEFNLYPVKIETKSGRDEYERLQRDFSLRAITLRKELIKQLKKVLDIAENIDSLSTISDS